MRFVFQGHFWLAKMCIIWFGGEALLVSFLLFVLLFPVNSCLECATQQLEMEEEEAGRTLNLEIFPVLS